MLAACIDRTVLREVREEILLACDGIPYLITERDIIRCSVPGELAADEPENGGNSPQGIL